MDILHYITLFVWIAPAIKNYKTDLFVFFILLAVHDPISYLFKLLIFPRVDISYTIFITFLMIFSLLTIRRKQLQIILIITSVLISLITYEFLTINTKMLFVVFQLAFIFLIMLRKFAEDSITNKAYNIFYIIVIFYLLTLILKFLTVFIGSDYAIEYFIITTVFQILFGLFFSIFREDDPRLLVKFE